MPCWWGRKRIDEGSSAHGIGGACLVVAIVLSKPMLTAVPPQASLLTFSSSAGILEQLFLRLLFHFGCIYIHSILLCGLNLTSHTCHGESSLSKKEYLVVVQVLDKMHEKAQDFKAMCLSKLEKFALYWIPQRPNVSGYILSVAAGSWSCVLCLGPRAHLHLLLTRQLCLKPVGISFCAGKSISYHSGGSTFGSFFLHLIQSSMTRNNPAF